MTLVDSAPATVASTPTGGPSLPQVRRLVTTIPGPRSIELMSRKTEAVAAGVGSTVPVFAAAADGGVIVDVDGNSMIDLGSRHRRHQRRHLDPAVVAAVREQVGHFTHTCFTVTPYDSYVEVAEQLTALTPGDSREAQRPVQFRRGSRRERDQGRASRHRHATPSSRSTTPITAAPTSRWR